MLDAIIHQIERYVGAGWEGFTGNELVRVWIIHHLVVLGEAAVAVSMSFRERFPDIPWKRIVALRNILVHRYFGFKLKEVWLAAERDLPALKHQLREILEEYQRGDS